MIMETAYQKEKVNNELEWCEVVDLELKERIEKVLLRNRVSYCINWVKPRFFAADKRERYIFCVNALQKETADEAIRELPEEDLDHMIFRNRQVDRTYI